MSETFKLLAQVVVPSTAGTLYSSASQAIVKYMVIVNPTASARTVTLWTGGSADANLVVPVTSIPAGGRLEFDGSMALGVGDTIVGRCDAASALTATVFGLEIA